MELEAETETMRQCLSVCIYIMIMVVQAQINLSVRSNKYIHTYAPTYPQWDAEQRPSFAALTPKRPLVGLLPSGRHAGPPWPGTLMTQSQDKMVAILLWFLLANSLGRP